MVSEIRRVERIIGQVSYELDEKKKKTREFARSLFVVQDVGEGEEINGSNVRSIRPGYGISPKYINQIYGNKFSLAVKRGTPLAWEMIKDNNITDRNGK